MSCSSYIFYRLFRICHNIIFLMYHCIIFFFLIKMLERENITSILQFYTINDGLIINMLLLFATNLYNFLFVSAWKLLSNVNSLFASAYVYHWPRFFRGKELYYPPSFDARVILYPTDKNLRDYLAWRQADVHINNLYNTCFWNLVLKGNLTPAQVSVILNILCKRFYFMINTRESIVPLCSLFQAEEKLKGTLASHKNELLFQEFGINYNNEPALFRKGTTLIRKLVPDGTGRLKSAVVPIVDDIIGDRFWKENPEVIGLKSLATYQPPNNINNTMPAPIPASPTIIKHENSVPSSLQVVNKNSTREEPHSNRNKETDEERMQCENERISRR